MKILTVFTGGTISCSERNGALAPDGENGYRLLALAEQAGAKAAFTTAQPYTVLSENLSEYHLNALRACIEENLPRGYDGIIVTHGTDTLQYTAAFLDLVFGKRGVPIVLVPANYPLADSRSNGLENFLAAVGVVHAGESGVFIAYRNRGSLRTDIHRGADALPHLPYDDSLYSIYGESYGAVMDGVFLRNPAYRERERADMSSCRLNGRVVFLRPYVGMAYPALTPEVKAVLLEGWHSGTLPTDSEELRALCGEAEGLGVPVYLTGDTEGFEYESKAAFGSLGIISLPPMSPIAAYMILWLM